MSGVAISHLVHEMNVGIDASRLRPRMSGIGRYVRDMLAPLDAALPEARFVLYAPAACDVALPSERWSVRCDLHPVLKRLPTSEWIHYRLGARLALEDLDVFWAANTLLPRLVGALPCVTTVYDLNHLLFPDTMPALTRAAHRRWFASDVRRAARVVAISEGTAARLKAHLGCRVDAIARPAVPLRGTPPDRSTAAISLAALGVRQPFLLTVGTREPRKNLTSAVAAVSALKAKGRLSDHQLVMAGAGGWGGSRRSNLAMEEKNWIEVLGYVDDATLMALYTLADVLLFPSLYEGYGIPLGEAQMYGCRAVATNSPELREAGGPDALYIEPTTEAIAWGIEMALSMPAPSARRPDHDWNDAAMVMATVLRQAAYQSG